MGTPVSIRLDEQVQTTLETAAKERGVGLSTYIRDLAAVDARRILKARIRTQSERVGDYVVASAEAREFYDDWGKPPVETAP